MNNFIVLFINSLAHVGIFTKDEAKALCDEMSNATLPDNFEGSYMLVENIFAKLEIPRKVSLKTELEDWKDEIESRMKLFATKDEIKGDPVVVAPTSKPTK